MGESNNSHSHRHAIVFPYPFQGHISPTLNFAVALASRGFVVTCVLTEFVHNAASKFGDFNFNFSGLDIRCATISDGFPLDFNRRLSEEFRESLINDFAGRADEVIGRITRSYPAAKFVLVADSLFSWPAAVAEKYGLVNVTFWTEPATVFSINYHLDLLRENGHFPNFAASGESRIDYIPGVRSISTNDLMSYIRQPKALPGVTKIAVTAFQQVKNADFILCNTVQELEPEALSALNHRHPTFAVGPITSSISHVHKHLVDKITLWPRSDCTDWLDSKPPGSVLYISFGSIARINEHELREIAHGLLLTQVNFLWVLRTDYGTKNAFPDGFLDDVQNRGIIVPWCNQNAVLGSVSVGAFLTHCGWNSVLDSIWSGVPMICHPLLVDQPTNRKLVVDDWRIGINLCDKEKVSREEFVRKIEMIMEGNECVLLKEEVKKVREVLKNAWESSNGSSRRNFDRFVEELNCRLLLKKN
ncbi:UDP-glycosyltransferase 86A1-like [Andrographis paniculata]|uniref:UDP-glycosyltransferase 86A1-like n=1 Tax=Andrographis paniculata TaxID=175694 RepID=UPI0021E9ACB4|nr:UDP-glycosyltransferase 86A1-like [Andrographis paniculata]